MVIRPQGAGFPPLHYLLSHAKGPDSPPPVPSPRPGINVASLVGLSGGPLWWASLVGLSGGPLWWASLVGLSGGPLWSASLVGPRSAPGLLRRVMWPQYRLVHGDGAARDGPGQRAETDR